MDTTLDVNKILARPKDDPAARVRKISKPIASPAQCLICGKDRHPVGFASFDNVDFEFYGSLYFCGDCVGDIARPFGFLSREEIDAVVKKLTAQEIELKILRKSVVNLENLVDAYTALRGAGDNISGVNSVRSESATLSAQTDSRELQGNFSEGTPNHSGVTSGDTETDQHGSSEGLNDLRATTGSDTLGLAEFGIEI